MLRQQPFGVAEPLAHPALLAIAEFPFKVVMALAAPKDGVLKAAADIAYLRMDKIVTHLIHHRRRHGMDVGIGDRSNAAAAAAPFGRSKRRHLNGRIVTEPERKFIVQGILHMLQEIRIPGNSVQIAHRTGVSQNSFGIHILVNIQRAAVTFLMADKGIVIPFFAAQQLGKMGMIASQIGIAGCR